MAERLPHRPSINLVSHLMKGDLTTFSAPIRVSVDQFSECLWVSVVSICHRPIVLR